jgi:hypothetical protein
MTLEQCCHLPHITIINGPRCIFELRTNYNSYLPAPCSKHTAKDFGNESRIVIQIRKKLTAAKAIVTKADKGNSLIIFPETDYNNKVHTFIANNNFTLVPHDTTKRLQRIVRTAINECKDTLPKETKWRHVSLNPIAPKIKGLIKIHKEDSP